MKQIFPSCYKYLRLYALDPYDLALSKLERNTQRERDDVMHLAKCIPLSVDELEERYRNEMRPYAACEENLDLTIKLWREMITERRWSQ